MLIQFVCIFILMIAYSESYSGSVMSEINLLITVINPLNIYLKWTLISFEDFQILTIELQRRLNMLSGTLTLKHNSDKNQKIRQMAWITNTIEDDRNKLEEMFWPTKKER